MAITRSEQLLARLRDWAELVGRSCADVGMRLRACRTCG